MVPVYFDELTTHGKRVDKDKVRPLLSALFEIHDAIDLKIDADSGFMAMANTTLRYHWLIRKLTRNKFSIEERTDMYLKATEAASLGWLINFVSSARGDYQVREDRQPTAEEDCLVSENVLPELTKRALNAIEHLVLMALFWSIRTYYIYYIVGLILWAVIQRKLVRGLIPFWTIERLS